MSKVIEINNNNGTGSDFFDTFQVELAEAIYDNQSEWPDELGFLKGDILNVVHRAPTGDINEGWWLCADHSGRRGIVPANRLRVIKSIELANQVITPSREDEQPPLADNAYYFKHFNCTVGSNGAGTNSTTIITSNNKNAQVGQKNVVRTTKDAKKLYSSFDLPGEDTFDDNGNSLRGKDTQELSLLLKLEKAQMANNRSFWTTEFSDNGMFNLGNSSADRMSSLSLLHRTKSPPPPQNTSTKKFNNSQNGNDPVKFVNPFYNQQSVNKNSRQQQHFDEEDFYSNVDAKDLEELYNTPMLLPRAALSINNNLHKNRQNNNNYGTNQKLLNQARNTKNNNNGYHGDNTQFVNNGTSRRNHNGYNANSQNNTIGKLPINNGYPRKGAFPVANGKAIATVAMGNGLVTVANGNGLKTKSSYDNNDAIGDSLSVSSVNSDDSDYQNLTQGPELPSAMNSIEASGRLVSLRQHMQINVRRLCAFATANCRKREFLSANLNDIRLTCRRTVDVLNAFVDFASGCFVNMIQLGRGQQTVISMSKKLAHLLRPLRKSLIFLIKLQDTLNKEGWAVEKFVREGAGNDSLDQFIAIAKQTPEDVRQVASFIHAKFNHIFATNIQINGDNTTASDNNFDSVERLSPQAILDRIRNGTDDVSENNNNNNHISACSEKKFPIPAEDNDLFDDYDFVEGHRQENHYHEIKNVIDKQDSTELDNNNTATDNTTDNISVDILDLSKEDKQILQFYTPQVENHMNCLSKVIDEFLACIERNEAPPSFVANGRLVVLSVHKMIYIGDNVAQCLKMTQISIIVKSKSDRLCEVLKCYVAATKQAAVQYPAIPSVQSMVDSMVVVSDAAHDLALCICSLASV